MDEADEKPRPGKDGEGAPKTLDGEESKSEEDKMIGRGMAPSSMHPDNEYHPDNHKTPAAYPLKYIWKGIDVEAEEKAEAEAAGRPYDFMRPEVDPAWLPGLAKKKVAKPTSKNQIRQPKRASSDRRLQKIRKNVRKQRESDEGKPSKPQKTFKERKAEGGRSNPRATSAGNVHNQLSSRNFQREGAMSVQDVRLTPVGEEAPATVDDIDARRSQDDGQNWDRMRQELSIMSPSPSPPTPPPPPPPAAGVARSPRDRAPTKTRVLRKDNASELLMAELQEMEMVAKFQSETASEAPTSL